MVGSAYIHNQPFRSTRPVIQLLLVEDSQVDSFLLSEALENDPISRFSLTVAERLRDGLQKLKQQHFDVVLLDFGLPDSQGLSTFEKLHQQAPDVPVVVLSGTSDEQLAIQAVQAGAQDYLVKGQIGWNSVARAVRYAIERQQNRSALDNSEKRFRALIENSADGIAMLRVDGTMFFVSPASLHILGYPPHEMEGVNVLDLVYSEDIDAANRLLDQAVEQQRTPITGQLRVHNKNGDWLWLEITVTNLLDEPGVEGVVANYRDITERKQAEQALRDQEAQYRAVIASSSDSFCMLDRQGRVIEVNETFVRQSGFSEDELLCMSASQVDNLVIANPKDSVEKPVKTLTFMETIAQTGSALFETQLQGKNRALWPVEISVSYRPIHGGRFFVFIRDISERKKANNALLRRTNELALLLEAGRALTSSLDLKEIFSQLYHFIARSVPCEAVLVSSYDRDEGLIRCRYVHDQQGECDTSAFPPIPYDPQGGDPQSLVITNGMPLLLPEYQGQQTCGLQTYGYAITDQDPAHDWRMRSTMLVPLIVEGKIAGVLQVLSSQAEAPTGEHLQYLEALVYRVSAALANAGLFQQVQTELLERRRAEEEVRQLNAELEQRVHERTADLSRANAGLEQAARAKDEFLASMSHELRTPLNAILTLTESLEEGTYTPVNDRQIPPLRTIAESGHHLLNLINDILDLSKIEAGKLSLIISRVEVEPVCQASMRLMRQMAQKKRLQITFEYDPSVVYLHADSRCMKQMLVNLLSNAVKFTPEGGEIGLRVKADRAQGAAHFTIWDNGIGIAGEHVSLLFKPFSQVDRGLDRQYGGTGLGLSLVYRMAELHGGSVSVESKPGEGSRFTISLPWSDPQTGELKAPPLFPADALAANGARSAEAARGPAARPVILLAEDNYANQQTYSDYLSAHGYQVIWAANGTEAIERAHETRPDLVLMDVQMPGMDGLEATRRLRLDALLSAVPIIALTALVMPGDRERCLSTGASDYLTKPVRLKRLVEVIEIHLKGKPNETNPSHR